MTRLHRLRSIRAIALNKGLRQLAEAERRVAALDEMQRRLTGLGLDPTASGPAAAQKAAAACRLRLAEAGVEVAAARDVAQAGRGVAAAEAVSLQVRVDVVDTALAAGK